MRRHTVACFGTRTIRREQLAAWTFSRIFGTLTSKVKWLEIES